MIRQRAPQLRTENKSNKASSTKTITSTRQSVRQVVIFRLGAAIAAASGARGMVKSPAVDPGLAAAVISGVVQRLARYGNVLPNGLSFLVARGNSLDSA